MSRPDDLVFETTARYPKLEGYILEALELLKPKSIPKEVFLPFVTWSQIAALYTEEKEITWEIIPEAVILQALGTWQYCKGIYDTPESLFKALTETELPKTLPMDIFKRLPEQCIYIKNPSTISGEKGLIYGWFVFLDYDYRNKKLELRILEDNEEKYPVIAPFEISDEKTLLEALSSYGEQYAQTRGLEGVSEGRELLLEQISPAIKILLYICSDCPEIKTEQNHQKKSMQIRTKHTKGKLRLFKPPKTRTWKVGEKLSKTLTSTIEIGSLGNRKSPHIRRAHWHGYWSGSRSGDRIFNYKWLPPTIINEDLVSTKEKDNNGKVD